VDFHTILEVSFLAR